jgi:cytochrome c biogenesis protein CcdA
VISTFQSFSGQSADVTLLTAFIAGTAASLGLCAAVRLPIVLAYVAGAAGSKRHGIVLSGSFMSGLIAGTVLLGLTAGSPDEGLRGILSWNKYLFWFLGGGLFVTGVLLSGLINPHLLPAQWQHAAARVAKTGSPGAFLLGCAFGLLQTPACPHCGGAIKTLVEVSAGSSLFYGLVLFAGFAAGQGITMLAVGVLASLAMPDLLRRLRTQMCSIEPRIQLLAGNVLMVLGIYFIIVG